MNFGIVFGQSWLNFRDCCQTVQAKISELFLGSFILSLHLVLIPRLMSAGFGGVSCYPNNSVTNHEGTKRCPILCGSEIRAILCVIVVKY